MNNPEPDYVLTGAEMYAQFLDELAHLTRWGRWRLNRRLNTLDFHDDLRGKV